MAKIINLLPAPKQQELKYESILHGLIKAMVISFCGFVVIGVFQFATKIYLEHKAGTVEADITRIEGEMSKNDNVVIKTKVLGINDVVTDFHKLQSDSPKWSKVFKAFAVLPPSDVSISSFVIDVPRRSIVINGYAPTRDEVIALYNNILADSKEFYNIDYPLENVIKEKNVNFHFSFMVQDSLLH